MTCREFVEFLIDYQSGDLPSSERGLFDRHLGACSSCRAYLDSYLKTIEMGRLAWKSDSDPLPPEVPEELVRAILEARRKT
jgi:predicted anti-sigma-YlaC factor YlaD